MGAEPADIAHHFRAGRAFAVAYTFGIKAAVQALDVFAFSRAAQLYAAAFSDAQQCGISPRTEVLERYADACLFLGQFASARESYQACLGRGVSEGRAITIVGKMGELAYRQSSGVDGAASLRQALQKLGYMPRRRWVWLSRLHPLLGVLVMGFQLWRFSRSKPESKDADTRKVVICRLCISLIERHYYDDFASAVIFGLSAGELAREIRPAPEAGVVVGQLSVGLSLLGLSKVSQRFHELSEGCVSATSSPVEAAWVSTLRGMSASCAADVPNARTAYARATRLLRSVQDTMRHAQVSMVHVELLVACGAVDEARRVSADLSQTADEVGDQRMQGWARYCAGSVAVRVGDHSQGLRDLAEGALLLKAWQGELWGYSASSRWALCRGFFGLEEQDLDQTRVMVAEFNSRGLRHTTVSPDAVLVALAAIHLKQKGRLPSTVVGEVRTAIRRCRWKARVVKCHQPLATAARGALLVAQGRLKSGARLIRRGAQLAEQRMLFGELQDVYRLGEIVSPIGGEFQVKMNQGYERLLRRFQKEYEASSSGVGTHA